jgi:hypothetical protein
MSIKSFNEFYNINSIQCKKIDLSDPKDAIDGIVSISFE